MRDAWIFDETIPQKTQLLRPREGPDDTKGVKPKGVNTSINDPIKAVFEAIFNGSEGKVILGPFSLSDPLGL